MVTFTAVKKVLDSFDPMGLLSAGAPSDEYWPEANDIAQRMKNGEALDAKLLVSVFDEWFYEGALSEELALSIVVQMGEI